MGTRRSLPSFSKRLQSRDLLQPRPVLVLEHHAGRIVGDDAADHVRRHDDAKRQRIVLDDEGDVRADRLDRLRVIGHDLVIRAQRGRRGDHDAGRALGHGGVRERPHRRESRRRDADDERQLRRAGDAARDNADRLVVIELRRFAHDAQNGAAVGPGRDIMVDHPVDAGGVDRAIVEKGRRRDGKDAFGVDGEHGNPALARVEAPAMMGNSRAVGKRRRGERGAYPAIRR